MKVPNSDCDTALNFIAIAMLSINFEQHYHTHCNIVLADMNVTIKNSPNNCNCCECYIHIICDD